MARPAWLVGSAAVAALAFPGLAAAHDARVPASRLAGEWRPSPFVLVIAGLALVLFVQAFVRLRLRGRADHAGVVRVPLFLAALALGTFPLVSPLDATGEQYLLSAHMLQHVLIADVAPALALLALRGPLLFFFVPPAILRPLARIAPLRGLARVLVRPRVAVGMWIAAFAAWHVPALYDYTLSHRTIHDLEHASFVLAGVLIWNQLIDPARRRELDVPRRLLVAAVIFGAGQALSYVLIFSMRPLYSAYALEPHRVLAIGPRLDQQLAGLVMMLEQLISLGTFAVLLLLPVVRRRTPRVHELVETRP